MSPEAPQICDREPLLKRKGLRINLGNDPMPHSYVTPAGREEYDSGESEKDDDDDDDDDQMDAQHEYEEDRYTFK